jgi:hypothetical protein
MDKLSNDGHDASYVSRLSDPAGCLAGGVFLNKRVQGTALRIYFAENRLGSASNSRSETTSVPRRDNHPMAVRLLVRPHCQSSETTHDHARNEAHTSFEHKIV